MSAATMSGVIKPTVVARGGLKSGTSHAASITVIA
jgi:hypothetical protein